MARWICLQRDRLDLAQNGHTRSSTVAVHLLPGLSNMGFQDFIGYSANPRMVNTILAVFAGSLSSLPTCRAQKENFTLQESHAQRKQRPER